MRKEASSFRLSKIVVLFAVALLAINCSSKISLWKEWPRPIDQQLERGILEILLENAENEKVKVINIVSLRLYDPAQYNETGKFPRTVQIHTGELYSGIPHETKVAPGEYFAFLHAGPSPFKEHDLQLAFESFFGFRFNSDSRLLSPWNSFEHTISKCNTPNYYEHLCQRIVIKKDKKTRIVIRTQKDAPVKSELGLRTSSGPRPIPLPDVIKTRETPEVLVEVQNPK